MKLWSFCIFSVILIWTHKPQKEGPFSVAMWLNYSLWLFEGQMKLTEKENHIQLFSCIGTCKSICKKLKNIGVLDIKTSNIEKKKTVDWMNIIQVIASQHSFSKIMSDFALFRYLYFDKKFYICCQYVFVSIITSLQQHIKVTHDNYVTKQQIFSERKCQVMSLLICSSPNLEFLNQKVETEKNNFWHKSSTFVAF